MGLLSLGFTRRAAGPAALLLRLVAGFIIAAHGWQKLDGGVSGFAGFVGSLGLPAPTALAYIVTGLELAGGILLMLGLLTRLSALLLTLEMVGTWLFVKVGQLGTGLIGAEATGYELDMMLFAAFSALVLVGPGLFAVDHVIGVERTVDTEASAIDVGRVMPPKARPI